MKIRARGVVAVRHGVQEAVKTRQTPRSEYRSILPAALQEELLRSLGVGLSFRIHSFFQRAPVMPGVAGGKWENIRVKGLEYLAIQKVVLFPVLS